MARKPSDDRPADGLKALVHWRLSDPAWPPSFAHLLDDARACIDPAASPKTVLSALREVVSADTKIAFRARAIALEARRAMDRAAAEEARIEAPPSAPRERLLPLIRDRLVRGQPR